MQTSASRDLLIKVLNGETSILTQQVADDDIAKLNNEAQARQMELQALMINYYKNDKAVNVKIVK
ncbi:hypothetical protein G7092_08535 [Mucilaginibacter sp. HC2]|uniref:hypothetical protein n=1 Tax=Mucilaginibacter inviolabilis TaxID=2714892 RepID=UPI0014087912|nr:hypothetical protein [Mucilaginibacter inviolabilis]NHA03839.1 hypothetical protein [Mucilaginibacter inviolabilis]